MVTFVGEATAHGCAFCGRPISFDDPAQLALVISNGGRETRFWAHRTCFHDAVQPSVWPLLDRVPPARRQDILPPSRSK